MSQFRAFLRFYWSTEVRPFPRTASFGVTGGTADSSSFFIPNDTFSSQQSHTRPPGVCPSSRDVYVSCPCRRSSCRASPSNARVIHRVDYPFENHTVFSRRSLRASLAEDLSDDHRCHRRSRHRMDRRSTNHPFHPFSPFLLL